MVINRGNVKLLPEMLRLFYGMGVSEFDLLQVIPFGRAFSVGRDTLFYDIAEMQSYITEALEFATKNDIHIWMNRFPPQHLEGYEHLIQDPYKLNDEVRGRKEEYARLLDDGTALDCRQPERCRYCYLQRLCDTLDDVRATVATQRFDVVRVDTAWESSLGPVFGGDPASAKRARQAIEEAQLTAATESPAVGDTHVVDYERKPKFRLPLLAGKAPSAVPTVEALVTAANATALWVKAPDLAAAAPVQVSCGSHAMLSGVIEARHTVLEGRKPLPGHAALVPPQTSCTSQTPAEARQIVPAATPVSAGHAAAEPVQFSATSQPPPLFARHTVLDGEKPSAGHAADAPVQLSATSQTPADPRHTVLDATNTFAGHALLVPLHSSATSHAPAEGRHVVPPDVPAYVMTTRPAPACTPAVLVCEEPELYEPPPPP